MKEGICFDRQVFNDAGKIVPGALLKARKGGSQEPAIMFTDIDLRVEAANPARANAGGFVRVYLDPDERYDLRFYSPEGLPIGHTIKIGLKAGERVIERTEVIKEAAPVPADDILNRLDAMERVQQNLDAARAETTPQPEAGVEAEREVIEPPAAIADLIREDTPYGEQATELLKRYNSLTNKIMMPGAADDADRNLHGRLHGALDWIKRHAVEVVG